jgi:nucleoside-diphosphate-sugar epimerase
MDEQTPTVAVTGAAGYLGSRTVTALRSAHPDWELRAFDDFSRGGVERVGDVPVRSLDVRDGSALASGLSGVDAVVHHAAVSDVDECATDPERAFETNAVGTERVAYRCREEGAVLTHAYSLAALGDPLEFPVDFSHPRDPVNWYGRTKLLNERAVDILADGPDGAPAHHLLLANLYGDHAVDGRRVEKRTVVTIFVEQALSGGPITVYEPGTQARNYVHVADVARAFVRSVETLLDARAAGETGASGHVVAGDEDPSVREVAELARSTVREMTGVDAPVDVIENPREETLVDRFPIDSAATKAAFGWTPRRDLAETVETMVRDRLDER